MRISVLLAAIVLLRPVSAQQPNTITLSCSGTQKLITTDDGPTSVENIGFVVDYTARIVAFASHQIPITGVDTSRVDFNGEEAASSSETSSPKHVKIVGFIDRVTGAASVLFLYELPPIGAKTAFKDAEWKMTCRPVSRQF
jgi:hypothetical protein